jgi:hypothetical protein
MGLSMSRAFAELSTEVAGTFSDSGLTKLFLECLSLSGGGTRPEEFEKVVLSARFGSGGAYGSPNCPTPSFAQKYASLPPNEETELRDFYLERLDEAKHNFPELFN